MDIIFKECSVHFFFFFFFIRVAEVVLFFPVKTVRHYRKGPNFFVMVADTSLFLIGWVKEMESSIITVCLIAITIHSHNWARKEVCREVNVKKQKVHIITLLMHSRNIFCQSSFAGWNVEVPNNIHCILHLVTCKSLDSLSIGPVMEAQ